MSLAQEIADIRTVLHELLHRGIPKSETHANALEAQLHANVPQPEDDAFAKKEGPKK